MITLQNFVRLLLLLLALYGIAVFTRPMFIGILNSGNAAGFLACVLFAIAVLFSSPLYRLLQRCLKTRGGKITIIAVGTFLLLGIIWVTILSVLMVQAASAKPSQPATLIVLGCKVKGDTPSLALQKRIDAAAEYLLQNPSVIVIVSGGQGPDEWISEAEAMKNRLLEKGIEIERIIMEDKSTSTMENLEFSKNILLEKGLGTNVIIVTEGYHMLRAQTLASRAGLDAEGLSSETVSWLLPTSWIREWFGNTLEFMRG
jgi:uncharacterized SAM-binding protein YcdF (DUF218 family)